MHVSESPQQDSTTKRQLELSGSPSRPLALAGIMLPLDSDGNLIRNDLDDVIAPHGFTMTPNEFQFTRGESE